MQIDISTGQDGIRTAVLKGRLDAVGTGEVETRLAGHFSGDHVRGVIDLGGVDFLASIGIRTLVLTAKSVQRRGGQLVLVCPNPEVHRILEIAGITDIIPTYGGMESALAVMAGNTQTPGRETSAS